MNVASYERVSFQLVVPFVALVVVMFLFPFVIPNELYAFSYEPGPLLFADDFSDDDIGRLPDGWRRSGPGTIEIIKDDAMISGKAVWVRVNPEDRSGTHLMGAPWTFPSGDPEAVVIEFMFKWIEGTGTSVFVSSGGSGTGADLEHHVNLFLSANGQLSYRGGGSTNQLKQLTQGWHRIRVVANRARDAAVVYVDDMDHPVGGPYPFRTPIDSWEGAYIYILHPRNTGNTGTALDAMYGQFSIWGVEVDDVTKAHSTRQSLWYGDQPKRPIPELPVRDTEVSFQSIPLTVAETSNLARGRQPVSSGVPFPRGHIWKTEDLRLVGPDDEPVSLQKTILSRWPDGSIRWLLLDFQTLVDAGEELTYVLEYGSEVTAHRAPCMCGITVKEHSDTITVDTERLKFVFGKEAPLLREVHLDGVKQDTSSPELVIVGAAGHSLHTSSQPYELTLEEAGSERVVLRVQGELSSEGGSGPDILNFAYDMRFHFYRDGHVVRIDPTITNLMGEHLIHRKNTPLSAVYLRFPGWLPSGDSSYVVGHDGKNVPGFISGQASSVDLIQINPNSFEVNYDGVLVGAGRRAPGWIHIENDTESIGVGVRHFWEQAPKSIRVDGKGNLTVYLLEPSEENLVMGGGEAKRHELYLSFGDEGKASLPGMLQPLRAVAPPQWYSETEAFGRPLFLVDHDQLPLYPDSVALYERFVDEAYELLMDNRDYFNEYGWRHFGDWSTTWDPNGWGNSEYDLAYVYFHQFARTGDLRYFDLAETSARHWMDVDMIWATDDADWVGGGMSHTSDHRGYAGEHHTWNSGMVENYHLTGDRRSLEAAMAVGDFFAHLALERPDRHRPRVVQNEARDVNTRSAGWALISLMSVYESTLDPYYLTAASTLVDFVEKEQLPDGQWPYKVAASEIASRPVATKPFMTAILLRGLGDYYRVTKDERVEAMMIKGLAYLNDHLWSDVTKGYPYIDHPSQSPRTGNLLYMDAYAYVYELTKDPEVLRIAREGFDHSMPLQINRLNDRTNLGKSVAQPLRHTTHSLAVLLEPEEYALGGPDRIRMSVVDNIDSDLLIVTRFHAEEVMRRTLHIENKPEFITSNWSSFDYTLDKGQTSQYIPIRFEANDDTPPGHYRITFRDDMKDDLTLETVIEISGRTLIDRFRPPVDDPFFGRISFEIADEMIGWVHVDDAPELYFGDAQRIRPKDHTEAILVYDVDGLFDFNIDVYIPNSNESKLEEGVRVYVQPKGETEWELMHTKVDMERSEHGSMSKATVSLSEPMYQGEVRMKVMVSSSGGQSGIELGKVEINTRD